MNAQNELFIVKESHLFFIAWNIVKPWDVVYISQFHSVCYRTPVPLPQSIMLSLPINESIENFIPIVCHLGDWESSVVCLQ